MILVFFQDSTTQIVQKKTLAEVKEIMETTTESTQKEISGLEINENKTFYVNQITIEIEEEVRSCINCHNYFKLIYDCFVLIIITLISDFRK